MSTPLRAAATLAALLCAAAHASEPPRLVLAISVDQMRGDYLQRFQYSKGMARLIKEGAVLTDAHHAHLSTETSPGHAAILTGKLPDRHGIVANEWYDRLSGKDIYSLHDSVHGRGPENLLAYTIGDALKARDPNARVVGVSIKDRSAILMAGKRADLAVWYDKKLGRAASSTYYGAEPAWLADLKAPESIAFTPAGDEFVLRLAEEVLHRYALGENAVTDLLAVSFSSPDYAGHKFGIDGPELKAQYEALDAVLARLLEQAEKRAGKGRVLAVLTADHGVVPAPEDPSGAAMKVRRVSWTAFGEQFEAKLQKLAPAPGKQWVLFNSLPNVYLNRALAEERGLAWPKFLDEAAAAAAKLDGVLEVHTSENYRKSELLRRSYYPGRSGDLLVLSKPATMFTDYPTGTTHGTHHPYDTHVPIIFWGPGIKPGTYTERAWVADIAPTLARVLGIEWAPIEGSRVQVEVLQKD